MQIAKVKMQFEMRRYTRLAATRRGAFVWDWGSDDCKLQNANFKMQIEQRMRTRSVDGYWDAFHKAADGIGGHSHGKQTRQISRHSLSKIPFPGGKKICARELRAGEKFAGEFAFDKAVKVSAVSHWNILLLS